VKIDCAVDRGRRERKRLLKVLFLKVRVILEQFPAIRIRRENFQRAPDGDSHPADAGVAAHFARLDRDSVEWRLEIHTAIMPRREGGELDEVLGFGPSAVRSIRIAFLI
jgi:hypothetical protein